MPHLPKHFQFDTDLPIRPFSEIQPQELQWLWPGRIPLGGVTLVAGDPGLGKSFLTIYVAARVSKGDEWGEEGVGRAPKGSVILLSAEDHPAQVIIHRLIAAGADLTAVHQLDDITRLAEAVRTIPDVRAIVIDPISVYLRQGNIRTELQSLKEMAEKRGIEVILVAHLNKTTTQKALYRVAGSIGITGIARATWIVVQDPKNSRHRLMLPTKFNLGKGGTGLAYEIVNAAVELDPEPIAVPDADLVIEQGAARETALQRAKAWLSGQLIVQTTRYLEDEDEQVVELISQPVRAIQERALRAGFSWRTIEAAKEQMGVNAERRGGLGSRGQWWWKCADTLSPQRAARAEPADLGYPADVVAAVKNARVSKSGRRMEDGNTDAVVFSFANGRSWNYQPRTIEQFESRQALYAQLQRDEEAEVNPLQSSAVQPHSWSGPTRPA